MKITKEEIKQIIIGITLIPSSSFKFTYLLLEDVSDVEKCYNCYYGGGNELVIYNSIHNNKVILVDYRNGSDNEFITDSNVDEISERIFGYIQNNITDYLGIALQTSCGDSEYEHLKYFGEEPKKFTIFLESLKNQIENGKHSPVQ